MSLRRSLPEPTAPTGSRLDHVLGVGWRVAIACKPRTVEPTEEELTLPTVEPTEEELTLPDLIKKCHSWTSMKNEESPDEVLSEVLDQFFNSCDEFKEQFNWKTAAGESFSWEFNSMYDAYNDANVLITSLMRGFKALLDLVVTSDKFKDAKGRADAVDVKSFLTRLTDELALTNDNAKENHYWADWFANDENRGFMTDLLTHTFDRDYVSIILGDEDESIYKDDLDDWNIAKECVWPEGGATNMMLDADSLGGFIKANNEMYKWCGKRECKGSRHGTACYYNPSFTPDEMFVPSAVSTVQLLNLFFGRDLMNGVPERMQSCGLVKVVDREHYR